MTTHLAHQDEISNCLDCGAAVTYHYCPVCGQEAKLHVASAREFIHEFVGHYVALEGKLWRSLMYLLLRPGFLTAEYIAGRRQRYVQPLRIYLTFSILFFALFKYGGYEVVNLDNPPQRGAVVAERRIDSVVMTFNPRWEQRINALLAKPQGEPVRVITAAFFSYGPYAIFALMPLFALYLKLLYLGSGRYYGEHLLFALHSNAVAYLLLGLAMAIPWGPLQFLCVLWLLMYLPLAMQRVYGGARILTALRWMLLALSHLISIALAITMAVGIAVLG